MSKIMFGNKEIKNPIIKVLAIIMGVIIAIAAIVFIVLPVLGVVLSFTISLLILIVMAIVLALPLILLIIIPLKLGKFNFSSDIDDKNLLETTANFGEFDLSNIKKVNICCHNGNLKIIGSDKNSVYASVEGIDSRFKYSTEKDTFNLVFKNQKEKMNIDIELPQTIKVTFFVGAGNLEYKNLKGFVDSNIGAGNISGENLEGSTKTKLGAGNINLSYNENMSTTQIDIKVGTGKCQIALPPNATVNTKFKSVAGKLNSSFPNTDDAKFHINMKAGAGNLDITNN